MISPDRFANPEARYRPAPFWSWNHRLEPERLKDMIRSMRDQGLGGYYMHARAGLKDYYLGEAFGEAVAECVEEGRRLGMYACLYDEFYAPSGSAGGFVTRDRPEYAAVSLVMRRAPGAGGAEAGETPTAGADLIATHTGPDGAAYSFRAERAPKSSSTGYPYADLLNPEAVAYFIKVSYDWYWERFGKDFGAGFTGVAPIIFSDEPDYAARYDRSGNAVAALPWSPVLEAEFMAAKGYGLRSVVPALFLDLPGYEKARFDFHDTLNKLFVKSYTKQIHDWCDEKGIDLTCHYWEHDFPEPRHQGNVMEHYAHIQVPGIDMLFNEPEEAQSEQFGFDWIVKELSSAAIHTGKERTMSETHGAGGWDVTFADMKRMLDWQFALGVNYIVPHLFFVSMEGDRKRDFPLSFNHEPWWGEYRLLGDYIGRMCCLLSEGRFVADTLVLHSGGSGYAEYTPLGVSGKIRDIGESARETVAALSAGQVYYDLGDETLLAERATVEGGKVRIGGMAYSSVVIPSMTVIKDSSVRMLDEFLGQGGFAVCTGTRPGTVVGGTCADLGRVMGAIPSMTPAKAVGELRARGAMGLDLAFDYGQPAKAGQFVYAHEREVGGGRLLFICNVSRRIEVSFKLSLQGKVTAYDAVSGEVGEVGLDGGRLQVGIPPCGSVCYLVEGSVGGFGDMRGGSGNAGDASVAAGPAAGAAPAAGTAPSAGAKAKRRLRGGKTQGLRINRIHALDGNMLTINECAVEATGLGWADRGVAVTVNERLMRKLGFEASFHRKQDWLFTDGQLKVTYPAKATYSFTAEAGVGPIWVAAEGQGTFTVSLNGTALIKSGFHIDRDIGLYEAGRALKAGVNEIMLAGAFGPTNSFESIYLKGEFNVARVRDGYKLVRREDPTLGDVSRQGYPFYGGYVRYEATADYGGPGSGRAILAIEGFKGTVARVHVNGRLAAVVGWEPYEAEVTEFLAEGPNEVWVDVCSSGQNVFGPHSKSGRQGLVHMGSFYDADDGAFYGYGIGGGLVLITEG